MAINTLQEIVKVFKDRWSLGDFIFGYENEINEKHNNTYPLLLVLPPTSEVIGAEGDVQEEYSFECLFVRPNFQNSNTSIESAYNTLKDDALLWIKSVLAYYTKKEVILSPDSISIEREKEMYNDKLIQVRLSFTLNAFTHDIPSYGGIIIDNSPVIWLRADKGVSTQIVGGTERVRFWQDQSGNDNHFEIDTSQSSSSLPNYYLSHSENSKPYISFNGTSQYLQSKNLSLNGLTSGITTLGFLNFTAFIVTKATGSDGQVYNGLLSINQAGANNSIYIGGGLVNKLKMQFIVEDNEGDTESVLVADASTKISSYAFRLDGSTDDISLYVDGTETEGSDNASFNFSATDDTNKLILGSVLNSSGSPDYFGQYDVQEVIVYDQSFSDTVIQNISTELQQKYNI